MVVAVVAMDATGFMDVIDAIDIADVVVWVTMVVVGYPLFLVLLVTVVCVPLRAWGSHFVLNGSSVTWSVDEDGVMVLRPTRGRRGVLRYNDGDEGRMLPPWHYERESIVAVVVPEGCVIECQGSMYAMFMGCSNLTFVDFGRLDMSGVTCVDDMFRGCHGLSASMISTMPTLPSQSATRLLGCYVEEEVGELHGLEGVEPASYQVVGVTGEPGLDERVTQARYALVVDERPAVGELDAEADGEAGPPGPVGVVAPCVDAQGVVGVVAADGEGEVPVEVVEGER